MFIGLALIAIGAILLLERLGVIEGGLGQYWPALLIAIGVSHHNRTVQEEARLSVTN